MQKRIHRVTVCLTEEEHLRLNEMCKATGLTMSKLIRFLLSGYLPAQAPPAEYSVLIKELRAVGNNLMGSCCVALVLHLWYDKRSWGDYCERRVLI